MIQIFILDSSDQALTNAITMVCQYEKNVHLVVDDSIEFLRNFDKIIDFLYLDSYDFEANNPVSSQMHHLHEIEVAYNKLAPNAVVMIDDCGLSHGGRLAINYLLNKV